MATQLARASSRLADLAGLKEEERPVQRPAGGLPRPNMKGYQPSLPQTKLYRQVMEQNQEEEVRPPSPSAAPAESGDSWSAPMLEAGLTMMASKNPSTMGALGEGGLAAMRSLVEQKKQRDADAFKREKWDEEKSYRERQLAMQGRPEYVNVHNPETGQRKTVAAGSPEFNDFLSQGYVVGDPAKPAATKTATFYNPENPDEIKTVVVGSPENEALLTGGWIEGNPALKKLSKPETVVNVGGEQEGEYGKAVAKKYADIRNGYIDAADIARGTVNRVSAMRRLGEQISTGALEPAKLAIKQIVKGMGADLADFGITDNTGAAEAYKSLAGRFMMDFIQQTKGAISERENALFQSFSPSLSKTPEGNAILLDWAERVAKRQLQVESLSSAYERENGQLDAGWSERLSKWQEENPILSDEDIVQAEALSGSGGQDTVTTDSGIQTPGAVESQPSEPTIDPDAASRDEMINFLQRKQSRGSNG